MSQRLDITTPESRQEAGGGPGKATRVRRVLLIANETLASPTVLDRTELRGSEPAEVFVVAPALTSSRFHFLAGEVDQEIADARQRLEATIETLRQLGHSASGEVGDSDPNLALEDALRRFDADEVVIATHPPDHSKWLEQDTIEKARHDVRQPVTHVVVDDAGRDVVAVEHVKGVGLEPDSEMDRATAYDLPRIPPRELAGLVVGIVGTIALGILAMSGGGALQIGLAAAAFIVTVFHVLGLLLFASVRYRGRWAHFAAITLLLGIPPAIVISLIAG
jgi:hypothetical protein